MKHFYLLIVLFVLFKFNHLQIPYFWDELGVYSRAALHMFDHQISLLPDALPPELSRGHPLLCAAVFAAGYRLFGPHVWAGHLTALLWSCGLLYVLFRCAEDVFDRKTALLACALLAVQPMFIAQSSMVLPEIMLAFFCTASLHAYLKGRFAQLALFSSCAILTKETAVALPVSFGLMTLFAMLRNGANRKRFTELLLICAPLAVWGVFLLIQRIQNGWFFFPLHKDYISFSLADILPRLGYYVSFLLKCQGRWMWTALMLTASLFFLCSNRQKLLSMIKNHAMLTEDKWRAALTIITYAAAAVLVSVLNFHLARYMLLIMPALCCLVAAQASYLMKQLKHPLGNALVVPLLLAALFSYRGGIFNVDADMGYLDIVNAQKEIVAHLNGIAGEDAVIAADFPVYHGLIDQRAGYSTTAYRKVVGCGSEQAAAADYFIFSSPGNLDGSCKPDERRHVLLKKIKTPLAAMLLYKRFGE